MDGRTLRAVPWLLAQTVRDLLARHHRVDAGALAARLPSGVRPDVDADGSAWVSVLAMRMAGVHPRWLPPVPGLSGYPQVGVRAFVRGPGDEAGVVFLRLEAPGRVVTAIGRRLLGLPYRRATVDVGAGRVTSDGFAATWRAGDPVDDAFLGERDVLFSVVRGRLRRSEVRHEPAVFSEAEATVTVESLLDETGLRPTGPAVSRSCTRLASHVWLPR